MRQLVGSQVRIPIVPPGLRSANFLAVGIHSGYASLNAPRTRSTTSLEFSSALPKP